LIPEHRASLLEEATGLPAAGSRNVHVRLDGAVGARSLQRAGLELWGERLALAVWPGELKSQAHAFYGTRRARALLDLVATAGWRAEPRPHLGFYGASPPQRLYLTPRLALADYVAAWSGPDLERVHAYDRPEVGRDLLPWLVARGHASPADRDGLARFERLLGRRTAHLRPAVRAWWEWPLAAADELDGRGALAAAVRERLAALLEELDEPPLPVASRP
jgi:hypothetical protein